MLVHDKPYPPSEFAGRLFVDRSQWMQIDPAIEPDNQNYPFTQHDRQTPYHELCLVGLFFNRSGVTVSFDVDLVDLSSLDSVLDLLASKVCQKPVRLEFYKDGWMAEQHVDGNTTVERIAEVMRHRSIPMLSRSFVQERHVSELEGSTPGLLETAFGAWKDNHELALLKSPLTSNRLIAFQSDKDGVLRYKHIGDQSALASYFGTDWGAQAIGRQTEIALPDPDYHRATAGRIQSAIEDGAIRYDFVLASVERPGLGRDWVSYRRLNVPSGHGLIGAIQLEPWGDLGHGFLRPK